MMAFHFIAIVSDYTQGLRIGWHYSSEEKLDKNYINQFLSQVKKKCGDAKLAVHKLSTDSKSWSSVVEKDTFFKDIFITKDAEEFVSLVTKDQQLSAYDVAKFILSIHPTSHLKLQKLLYYVYTEFLLRTGEKLFKEPIVAYKYGPVIEDVFQRYKSNGSSVIDYGEDATITYSTDDVAVTPSFMKMASSEHGITALDCVLAALDKYEDFNAGQLVDRTHQPGGPWDRVYQEGKNAEVSDDLILQYHHIVQ